MVGYDFCVGLPEGFCWLNGHGECKDIWEPFATLDLKSRNAIRAYSSALYAQ